MWYRPVLFQEELEVFLEELVQSQNGLLHTVANILIQKSVPGMKPVVMTTGKVTIVTHVQDTETFVGETSFEIDCFVLKFFFPYDTGCTIRLQFIYCESI